jgi:hypothetical protein
MSPKVSDDSFVSPDKILLENLGEDFANDIIVPSVVSDVYYGKKEVFDQVSKHYDFTPILKMPSWDGRVECSRGSAAYIDVLFECVCGKQYPTYMLCTNKMSFSFSTLLSLLEEHFSRCRCDLVPIDEYHPEYGIIFPESPPWVRTLPSIPFIEVYTHGSDPRAREALKLPITLRGLSLLSRYSIFDSRMVQEAILLRRAKHDLDTYERVIHEMSIPMASCPSTCGLFRYLFENGRIEAHQVAPGDSKMFYEILGYYPHTSDDYQFALLAQMFFTADSELAKKYVLSIVATDKFVLPVRKEMERFKQLYDGIVRPEKKKQYVRDGGTFPGYLTFFVALREILGPRKLACLPAGDYTECTDLGKYTKYAVKFDSAFSLLNVSRQARKEICVLDGFLKYCSSFATWHYGNAYSTIRKWQYEYKKYPSILAAGCAKNNWWALWFPSYTVFIDTKTYGNRQVHKRNILDVKEPYDLICSDVQVPLDYSSIVGCILSEFHCKVLPSFGEKWIRNHVALMVQNSFKLIFVRKCGRLHNGEVIIGFQKMMERSSFKNVDMAIKSYSDAILGIMAVCMIEGGVEERKYRDSSVGFY